MKILFPYMARWHAVNWTRYHSLLSAIAEKGHEVHVLQTPRLNSAETNFQEIKLVKQTNLYVHEVPINNIIWNMKTPFEKLVKKALCSIKSYQFSRAYVQTYGIDAILLYNIPQYQFMKIPGVLKVFDYADDYIDMLSVELGSLNNPLALGIARKLLDNMMQQSQLTLSVSHELAKQVNGRVSVLPNGVSAAKSALKKGNGKTKWADLKRPIIGFLGSFEYFIDFKLILSAAKVMPDVHFLLVGTGRDWESVKSHVEDMGLSNVELTGGVPHDQIFEYIQAMDICLNIFLPIPVSHRACPLKLFEYLSQTKPVISTRLKELEHIDEDFLYYADSPSELVDSIRLILKNEKEAKAKAEIGNRVTLGKYTWEKIGDQFIELLEQAKRN